MVYDTWSDEEIAIVARMLRKSLKCGKVDQSHLFADMWDDLDSDFIEYDDDKSGDLDDMLDYIIEHPDEADGPDGGIEDVITIDVYTSSLIEWYNGVGGSYTDDYISETMENGCDCNVPPDNLIMAGQAMYYEAMYRAVYEIVLAACEELLG